METSNDCQFEAGSKEKVVVSCQENVNYVIENETVTLSTEKLSTQSKFAFNFTNCSNVTIAFAQPNEK